MDTEKVGISGPNLSNKYLQFTHFFQKFCPQNEQE